MFDRKCLVDLLCVVGIWTCALFIFTNSYLDQTGNYAILIAEVGIGIGITMIVYYLSSKNEEKAMKILKDIKVISDSHDKLMKTQEKAAKQKLREMLDEINMKARKALQHEKGDPRTRYKHGGKYNKKISDKCKEIRTCVKKFDNV